MRIPSPAVGRIDAESHRCRPRADPFSKEERCIIGSFDVAIALVARTGR